METVTKKGFKVIGIKVRTTNEGMQAAKDIGDLWNRFMSESIAEKIPNKIDTSILSIYTNYDSDYTKPYDTILGCSVSSLEKIPEGMVGQQFNQEKYVNFISKGNLTQGAVYNTWTEIWNQDLDRTYTADFEVYGDKAQDPTDAEVEIFVAIN